MSVLDPEGVETVRAYMGAALQKDDENLISFNEGIMCAAFALGAYIDGLPRDHAGKPVLERIFNDITNMRQRRPRIAQEGR